MLKKYFKRKHRIAKLRNALANGKGDSAILTRRIQDLVDKNNKVLARVHELLGDVEAWRQQQKTVERPAPEKDGEP